MTGVKGSCLCGSITFESEAKAVLTGICHCRHCRKQGGGAFSINLAVPRASLRIEGRTLKTFRDHAMLPDRRHCCSKPHPLKGRRWIAPRFS